MSYLIAMYVFYHGNNLPLFGVTPGMQEEKPKNQGLERATETELSKVLPEDVSRAIVEERQKLKAMDYEEILRQAIADSQNETAKIRNSSIGEMYEDKESSQTYTTYEDDFSEYDMSFFDELNGLKGRNDDNSGWFF